MADFRFAASEPGECIPQSVAQFAQLTARADVGSSRVIPPPDGPSVVGKLQHWPAQIPCGQQRQHCGKQHDHRDQQGNFQSPAVVVLQAGFPADHQNRLEDALPGSTKVQCASEVTGTFDEVLAACRFDQCRLAATVDIRGCRKAGEATGRVRARAENDGAAAKPRNNVGQRLIHLEACHQPCP